MAGVMPGLRHPGPRVMPRVEVARGVAVDVTVEVADGEVLLGALGRGLGGGALVVDLAGLTLEEAVFVQPAESSDADHAAWYSDARQARDVTVRAGVAMLGWRGGEVFAHAHALWDDGGRRMLGHLLADRVRVGAGRLRGVAFTGGRLVQAHDPETHFSLFRIEGDSGGRAGGDAAILTLRPHEDLVTVIGATVAHCGWSGAEVMGLGSLIGARFDGAAEMTSPISEMLMLPGARTGALAVAAVDLGGRVFEGRLVPGGGAICVTAEVLLRRIGA